MLTPAIQVNGVRDATTKEVSMKRRVLILAVSIVIGLVPVSGGTATAANPIPNPGPTSY